MSSNTSEPDTGLIECATDGTIHCVPAIFGQHLGDLTPQQCGHRTHLDPVSAAGGDLPASWAATGVKASVVGITVNATERPSAIGAR